MARKQLQQTMRLGFLLLVLAFASCGVHAANYNYIQCGKCDEERCPKLAYCEGKPIKDDCGCCTRCSSNKFQPHIVPRQKQGACREVKCPTLKVCMENVQGVPLCKCPSQFICGKNKKKPVCGSDGVTYQSRCHMRIASCNQGVQIRKKYRGPCVADESKVDMTAYKKRMKRLKKRRRRRQRKRKESMLDTEPERKKKKHRRRRRRKSGNRNRKVRRGTRRPKKNIYARRSFLKTFGSATWDSK